MIKNILYIDTRKGPCNYYNDMIKYLKKQSTLTFISDNNYNETTIMNTNPDLIILGFGLTNTGDGMPKFKIEPKDNKNNIPIYIILNKEYAGLENKFIWIKSFNPKKVFTVHHDYDKYEKKLNIPFVRIMWSADQKFFKKYDDEYKNDLFFSGVIRKEQTDNIRYKIYNKLNEIKDYKLLVKAKIFMGKKVTGKTALFSNVDYAKEINHSKIILTTTGPADLVGTRYFEIMASNKALILCNRMPKNVYDDIIIDKFNCVMFDNENDFIEKFKYYIEHEDERIKIVNNAYKYFLEKHTWEHKVKHLLNSL